jgi:hypothetical protein
MDYRRRREVILPVLSLLVALALAVAAHPHFNVLSAAAFIVSYAATRGYLRYAILAGGDIHLRRLAHRFASESEEVSRIAQEHGLTAHAYELRRTARSMSRKVSAYLRHSDSRRSWAITSVWVPLLVYMMIAGSSVRGVDNAGNVTEPPPLWTTLWWLFVFAGCVLLFCPGSELRRRQESLLEMTRRSFVDLRIVRTKFWKKQTAQTQGACGT